MAEREDGNVAKYLRLRDFKEQVEREMKEKIAKIDAAMEPIAAELMSFLNEVGAESVNTKEGTFFKRMTTSCKVSDWDVILPFIKERDLWNFLEQRVSKTAIAEFIELYKEVPPGVSIVREVKISVNRPKTR